MEYTGQLTVDDAVRGYILQRRRHPGWRWWLLAPGLLLLGGLAGWSPDTSGLPSRRRC
jgi:hypothetical protein